MAYNSTMVPPEPKITTEHWRHTLPDKCNHWHAALMTGSILNSVWCLQTSALDIVRWQYLHTGLVVQSALFSAVAPGLANLQNIIFGDTAEITLQTQCLFVSQPKCQNTEGYSKHQCHQVKITNWHTCFLDPTNSWANTDAYHLCRIFDQAPNKKANHLTKH